MDLCSNNYFPSGYCPCTLDVESIATNKFAYEGQCTAYHDGVLCWPRTYEGFNATLPCPRSVPDNERDKVYIGDPSYNVTRACINNTWQLATYDQCEFNEEITTDVHLVIMYIIYLVGYSVSLVFLVIALIIFIHYKQLWCLRNIIHTNLIACFALHNFSWIVYSIIGHVSLPKIIDGSPNLCVIPTTLLKYFIAAGFFWMFVEGAFLFVTIMFSFHAQKIRFWLCALIGWDVGTVNIIWTTFSSGQFYFFYWLYLYYMRLPLQQAGPVNLIFLFAIMYVIVMKLRLTVRAEAERYKKAAKALLILCPLLGINYVLVLAQPSRPTWLKLIFDYYIAIMNSSQGLLVALFFCFRNNEVMQVVAISCRQTLEEWTPRGGMDNPHATYIYNKLFASTLSGGGCQPTTTASIPPTAGGGGASEEILLPPLDSTNQSHNHPNQQSTPSSSGREQEEDEIAIIKKGVVGGGAGGAVGGGKRYRDQYPIVEIRTDAIQNTAQTRYQMHHTIYILRTGPRSSNHHVTSSSMLGSIISTSTSAGGGGGGGGALPNNSSLGGGGGGGNNVNNYSTGFGGGGGWGAMHAVIGYGGENSSNHGGNHPQQYRKPTVLILDDDGKFVPAFGNSSNYYQQYNNSSGGMNSNNNSSIAGGGGGNHRGGWKSSVSSGSGLKSSSNTVPFRSNNSSSSGSGSGSSWSGQQFFKLGNFHPGQRAAGVSRTAASSAAGAASATNATGNKQAAAAALAGGPLLTSTRV